MKQSPPIQRITEKLRGMGIRPTRQRVALASLLFTDRDRHVTAEILHGEAVKQRINVSLATVYNTLNQFTRHGILREVHLDSDVCWFDTNTSPHHHFIFDSSGKVCDIDPDSLRIEGMPALPEGHHIHHIELVIHLASTEELPRP